MTSSLKVTATLAAAVHVADEVVEETVLDVLVLLVVVVEGPESPVMAMSAQPR